MERKEMGHENLNLVLRTQEASILIFSSGNVAETAMMPASVFWEVFH